MKKVQKMLSYVLVMAMVLGVVGILPARKVSAAVAFQEIPVTVLTDMTNYDQQVNVSWSKTWNIHVTEEKYKEECYMKFTLPKDSIVRIKGSAENIESSLDDTYYIYGNESMGTLVHQFGFFTNGSTDDWLELSAGTYYVKEVMQLKYWYLNTTHTSRFSIGVIAKDDAVKFKQTPNKTKSKSTVSVSNIMLAGLDDVRQIRMAEGKIPDSLKKSSSTWGADTSDSDRNLDVLAPKFTVKKNGWYTVRIITRSTVPFGQEGVFLFYIKVTGVDTTAPTVTGVKNGKTYKKTVTIKYSDKGSGIKKATLNGKKIKSGTKVKKKGSYTLVVTDKAGNKKTVKFKMK